MTFDLDTATNAETFNVFDFVTGAALPEEDYTIYTNGHAALKLAKIFEAESIRRKEAENDPNASIADEPVASEDEITALHTALVESGLVFHMQGLAPHALEELQNTIKEQTGYVEGQENENFFVTMNNTLVANSIKYVTNHAGAVDKNKWTPQMVKSFAGSLYVSEQTKLYAGAGELTYIGAIFDGAVTADFS